MYQSVTVLWATYCLMLCQQFFSHLSQDEFFFIDLITSFYSIHNVWLCTDVWHWTLFIHTGSTFRGLIVIWKGTNCRDQTKIQTKVLPNTSRTLLSDLPGHLSSLFHHIPSFHFSIKNHQILPRTIFLVVHFPGSNEHPNEIRKGNNAAVIPRFFLMLAGCSTNWATLSSIWGLSLYL